MAMKVPPSGGHSWVTEQHAQATWANNLARRRYACTAPSPQWPALSSSVRRWCGSSASSTDSLIPQTLAELDTDLDYLRVLEQTAAQGQEALTREEKLKRQRSLDQLGCPSFQAKLQESGVSSLKRGPATILQLNIGLYCNQACNHCHVESSPRRTEMMDRATAERCIDLVKLSGGSGSSLTTVDLTGGAPELNSQFRYLVRSARDAGLDVIDRCNLTVLLEPGQEDLVQFLADHHVHVVASLPCYSQANVDAQRGSSVFDRSIRGLQMLNDAGYGKPGTGLVLDLVYNPGGAALAPAQAALEVAYKEELGTKFGITFNKLFCLNNMPIKRFVDWLQRRGQLQEYMQLLLDNFNPGAAEGIMCRNTISVGWDGRLYDCDFNQQLAIPVRLRGATPSRPATVFSIENLDELEGLPIACDNHCFGCTAGAGSSCQGATS